MAGRILLGIANPALDADGAIDAGSTLTVYQNGTQTLVDIFSDADLATPLTNPLSCDAAGRFPIIWADDTEAYSVKWTLTGEASITFDDIIPTQPTTAAAISTTYSFTTTVALLAAFDGDATVLDGAIATTAGRTSEDDGGGATFYYKESDTTTVDDKGSIRVDGEGRRWYALVNNSFWPRLFGAAGDGTTDDAVAINAMLTAAAVAGATCKFQGLSYVVKSTLSVDIGKVLVDLEGSMLDFTDLAASPAIAPTTSLTDANQMVAAHRAHPIRNGTINGAGKSSGFSCFTPVAVTVSGSSSMWLPGITYQNVGVHGFAVMHDIVSGDFFLNMTNCSYAGVTGEAAGWALRSVGATNAGENMQITNFIMTNGVGFYLEETSNGNMDINVNNASIDGVTYIATGGTLAAPGTDGFNAQIKMFGGHWESIDYTDYAVWCKASFITYGVDQLLTGDLANVPFKCTSTQVAPGIVLNDHSFVSDGTATFPGGHVCDGTGRFSMSQKGLGNTFIFSGAISNNRVPSYTFPTSDSLTTNWGASAQYDSTDKPTGATGSCKLDGSHTTGVFSAPCSPGQAASAQIQLKISSPGTSDNVAFTVKYVDAGGNALTGGAETDTATAADYTAVQCLPQAVAPPGTVSAQMKILYVASGGGATVRFGLPEFQIL